MQCIRLAEADADQRDPPEREKDDDDHYIGERRRLLGGVSCIGRSASLLKKKTTVNE